MKTKQYIYVIVFNAFLLSQAPSTIAGSLDNYQNALLRGTLRECDGKPQCYVFLGPENRRFQKERFGYIEIHGSIGNSGHGTVYGQDVRTLEIVSHDYRGPCSMKIAIEYVKESMLENYYDVSVITNVRPESRTRC